MKLGTENKTKTAIAGALLAVAAFFVFNALHGGGETAPPPTPTASTTSAENAQPARDPRTTRRTSAPLLARTLDPSLRFDLLKSSEDVTYEGNGRDIFRATPEPPPIPKPLPPDQQPVASGPPPPPPPPPINLKFYGLASRKDGYKRVFASRGEDIFVAKEGDIVDRRYKILHIGTTSVDVEDVLTNNRQTLPLNAG